MECILQIDYKFSVEYNSDATALSSLSDEFWSF